ncbi:MAG: crossover junction endodeoxyribonuclease RuvC [Aaplasma endosymbiont of Hyalomma asiaticum]
MLVLGVDPGLSSTGWALLRSCGSVSLVDHGVINTHKDNDLNQKLYSIFSAVDSLLKSYSIVEAAIENVFVNSNAKASMLLCYARSASLIALMANDVAIFEYAPTTIKKRVFGNGKASKEQIQFMVHASLGLCSSISFNLHTSDAISAALCHIFSRKMQKFV